MTSKNPQTSSLLNYVASLKPYCLIGNEDRTIKKKYDKKGKDSCIILNNIFHYQINPDDQKTANFIREDVGSDREHYLKGIVLYEINRLTKNNHFGSVKILEEFNNSVEKHKIRKYEPGKSYHSVNMLKLVPSLRILCEPTDEHYYKNWQGGDQCNLLNRGLIYAANHKKLDNEFGKEMPWKLSDNDKDRRNYIYEQMKYIKPRDPMRALELTKEYDEAYQKLKIDP